MSDRLTVLIKVFAAIILAAIILLGFIAFIERIPIVATAIVGVVFLVYIIFPAVRVINRSLPLWASILVVYAIVLCIAGGALVFIVPILVANTQGIVHDAPGLVHRLQLAITDPQNRIFSRLPAELRSYLLQIPSQLVELVQRYGAQATTRVFRVVISIASGLALFVVIPVVALYLLFEIDDMRNALLANVPSYARPRVVKIALECNAALGGFIRGQLLVAAIVGALAIALLEVLHVPYPILIGVLAGALEIVPYLGAIVGAVLASAVALVSSGWEASLFVIAGFAVINQIEGHLIYPFVLGGSVGLSPLLVILALLVGGELFGIPGLMIAVPVAAIVQVLLANLLPQREPLELEPTLRRARRLTRASALAKLLARAKARASKN